MFLYRRGAFSIASHAQWRAWRHQVRRKRRAKFWLKVGSFRVSLSSVLFQVPGSAMTAIAASFDVTTVPTQPIAGQKPGTSGLRKKTKEFNVHRTTSRILFRAPSTRCARRTCLWRAAHWSSLATVGFGTWRPSRSSSRWPLPTAWDACGAATMDCCQLQQLRP